MDLKGFYLFKFLCIISKLYSTSAVTCYSCSYVYNEISLGFECASEPWNVTTANLVTCDVNRVCYTKTVYTPGYGRIQSVSRSCGNPSSLGIGCGVDCCQPSVYDVTCQSTCSTNFCNDGNVVRSPQTPAPPGNVRDSGPSIMTNSQYLTVFISSIFILIHVFWIIEEL